MVGGNLDILTPLANQQGGANQQSTPMGGVIKALQDLTIGQAAMTAAINALTTQLSTQQGFVTPPANSASAGVAGQMSYDPGFFYICVAANTWRRVAIVVF